MSPQRRRPSETIAIPMPIDDTDSETVLVSPRYLEAMLAVALPLPEAQDLGGVLVSPRYMQRVVDFAAAERRARRHSH